MEELKKKAELLSQALPYIKKYSGKIFVIKYGGNAMSDPSIEKSVLGDVALLKHVGINPILVHGGGPEINREMQKEHLEPKFINGLRYTDRSTMRIARKVFLKINSRLRSGLKAENCKAIDASANLLQTREKKKSLGLVGDIVRVNKEKLLLSIKEGKIPVVSPIGFDGRDYNNVNADTVAAKIAECIKAEKLTMLTNVEGVYENGKLISHLSMAGAQSRIKSGVISKGMIPKVLSCAHALKSGVKKAHLIDGTVMHSLLLEFFTDKGVGTEIVKNEHA